MPFSPRRFSSGNAAVREKQFGRILAVQSHLVEGTALLEAGGPVFDQVERDGLVGIFFMGIFGRHDGQVAEDAVGDEGLHAIDHQLPPIFFGRGRHAAQVAAGARLAHGHRGNDVAGGASRKIGLLLGVIAVGHDVRHHDVAVQRCPQPAVVGTRDFLDADDRKPEIPAQPAVGRGQGRAEKAFPPHFPPHLPGDPLIGFPSVDMGHHFPVHEGAQPLPEIMVGFGVVQDVHGRPFLKSGVSPV